MKPNNPIKELEEAKTGFIQSLSVFSLEQFNTVPFAGSWTAGQRTYILVKFWLNGNLVCSGKTHRQRS